MSDSDDQQPGIDPNAPPLIVHGNPLEIVDGVFIVPDDRVSLVPNVGIIVGDRAALVVDCGTGPKTAPSPLVSPRSSRGTFRCF